jgi:hypothetical protein
MPASPPAAADEDFDADALLLPDAEVDPVVLLALPLVLLFEALVDDPACPASASAGELLLEQLMTITLAPSIRARGEAQRIQFRVMKKPPV